MNVKPFFFLAAAALAAGMVDAALPQKINLRERDKLLAELAEKEKHAEKPLSARWRDMTGAVSRC